MLVVICDDRREDSRLMEKLVEEYGAEHRKPVECLCYESGEALLADEAAMAADALLLDIYLTGMSGIALARTLRKSGFSAPIVLVTTSVDHYAEGFEVEAVHYLQKPVKRQELFDALDRAVRQLRNSGRKITVTSGRRQRQVPLSSILYVEVRDHQTTLVTTAGELPLSISLTEAEALLDDPRFCRCFRSYVVNLAQVESLADNCFQMSDGQQVPITRRNLAAVQEAYMDYLFRNGKG